MNSQRIKVTSLFLIFIFIFGVKEIFAQEICLSNDDSKKDPKICFFALNGPEESEGLSNDDSKKKNHSCSRCLDDQGKKVNCEDGSVMIKEFYACQRDKEVDIGKGGNVSKAFEEMTKERCDGLVISGHHVGYYTGEKTHQENPSNSEVRERTANQDTISLDFLENLSCLKEKDSSNCQEWFSNIKYVHLHGSYTAGRTIKSGETFDQMVASKIKEYSSENWLPEDAKYLNQEYASTVDQRNPLTSRYLRMFPEALVFGWSGTARKIDQGSPEDVLEHIKIVGKIAIDQAGGSGGQSNDTEKFKSFLDWLGDDSMDPLCDQSTWEDNKGSLRGNRLFDNDLRNKKEKELGCQLSEAVREKDTKKIKDALSKICNSESCETNLLQQNINRIFSILSEDTPLSSAEQNKILESLKNNEALKGAFGNILSNPGESIVQYANHLYLYKKIFNESEKTVEFERNLIKGINERYLHGKGLDPSSKVYNKMLTELIWKNNLGQDFMKSLLGRPSSAQIEKDGELMQKLAFSLSSSPREGLLVLAATSPNSAEEDIPAIREERKKDGDFSWEWVGLQLKNNKYKNLNKLANDMSDDEFSDLSEEIFYQAQELCIENPFDQLKVSADETSKARILQERKDTFKPDKRCS